MSGVLPPVVVIMLKAEKSQQSLDHKGFLPQSTNGTTPTTMESGILKIGCPAHPSPCLMLGSASQPVMNCMYFSCSWPGMRSPRSHRPCWVSTRCSLSGTAWDSTADHKFLGCCWNVALNQTHSSTDDHTRWKSDSTHSFQSLITLPNSIHFMKISVHVVSICIHSFFCYMYLELCIMHLCHRPENLVNVLTCIAGINTPLFWVAVAHTQFKLFLVAVRSTAENSWAFSHPFCNYNVGVVSGWEQELRGIMHCPGDGNLWQMALCAFFWFAVQLYLWLSRRPTQPLLSPKHIMPGNQKRKS